MHNKSIINQILNIINKFEDALVIFFLSSILILALIQIVLRNFFDSGLIWGDSLLSILVLWLGLTGSIVASRQNKHINIDVFSHYLPATYKNIVKSIASLFAAIVCMVISYYSFIFILSEFELNDYVFAKVPAWIAESIIPIAFFIMGVRYFLQMISPDNEHPAS